MSMPGVNPVMRVVVPFKNAAFIFTHSVEDAASIVHRIRP